MKKRTKQPRGFAVCIDNTGYLASLEVGKLYQTVPDAQASKHGLIRVIDESGEDYGYSASRFFVLEIPHELARALKRNLIPAKQPNEAMQPTARRVPPARSLARKERVLGGG